jgi:hypothetical protein
VEVQRRCGDVVSFFRLYQKLVKSCSAIVACAFDNSCKLPTTMCSFAPLPLPGLPASALDLPSVNSLCSMIDAKQIECKREASRCLLQAAHQGELFPTLTNSPHSTAVSSAPAMPLLSRASSTRSTASSPATEEATAALWAALVSLLRSSDGECARLGASILRACLARKQAAPLLEHLDADLPLQQLLTAKIADDNGVNVGQDGDDEQSTEDAFAQREFKREISALFDELAASRRGVRAF